MHLHFKTLFLTELASLRPNLHRILGLWPFSSACSSRPNSFGLAWRSRGEVGLCHRVVPANRIAQFAVHQFLGVVRTPGACFNPAMSRVALVFLIALCPRLLLQPESLRCQETALGSFESQSDIGKVLRAGSVEYDPVKQTYLIAG